MGILCDKIAKGNIQPILASNFSFNGLGLSTGGIEWVGDDGLSLAIFFYEDALAIWTLQFRGGCLPYVWHNISVATDETVKRLWWLNFTVISNGHFK